MKYSPSGPIPGAPSCPKCGKPMALRTAKTGRKGSQFWGCSNYPLCKATRPLNLLPGSRFNAL